MNAKLSTHVLDTMHGAPAEGVAVELWKDGAGGWEKLKSATTNSDGRCDDPLLVGDEVCNGIYELRFEVGKYFQTKGVDSPFLDCVPVRFKMKTGGAYHVPLVCSPYSYSSYRGS